MDDLLKDAIADAKAVRETALANAKIALEEAFTPRIQSMLSDKIQSEIEGEEDQDEGNYDEGEHEGEEAGEEKPEVAVEPEVGEEASDEIEDVDSDEIADEDEIADADEMHHEGEHEEEADEISDGIIEIDGVKYAPVVSEEEMEDVRGGMGGHWQDIRRDWRCYIVNLTTAAPPGPNGIPSGKGGWN